MRQFDLINDVIRITLPAKGVYFLPVVAFDTFPLQPLKVFVHFAILCGKIPGALLGHHDTSGEQQLPLIRFEHDSFFGHFVKYAGSGAFADGIGSIYIISGSEKQAGYKRRPHGDPEYAAGFLFDLIKLD